MKRLLLTASALLFTLGVAEAGERKDRLHHPLLAVEHLLAGGEEGLRRCLR